MKKIKLFLIFILGISLFADEVQTQFTSGVNQSVDCQIECPPIKEGYFARIAGFSFESGETSCYVYSTQAPSALLATVVNKNPHCAKELINPIVEAEINSNTGAVNTHLSNLRSQIMTSYTDGGDNKYINLPKYMVAGLMADDNIIDIASSINNNEVTLNGGYTNVPNLSLATTDADGTVVIEFVNRAKNALANSVTFIINFLSLSDKILLSFKVTLFLFVGALSIILIISQKATKKISQVGDHEDFIEKGLFGFLSILIFFFTLTKIETPSGEISQTGYQQVVRPLLYLGVDTADKLTETATASILKYKFAGVGVVATEDIQRMKNQRYAIAKKLKLYEDVYTKQCLQMYNVANTKQINNLRGSNFNFPNSEYTSYQDSALGQVQLNFYNKKFLNSESFMTANGYPSISYCFKAERGKNEFSQQLREIDDKIASFQTNISEKVQKKIKLITDLSYRNVAELGFLSVGNMATTTMAFNNFSLIDKSEAMKNKENFEQVSSKVREATGYEVSGIVDPNQNGWVPFQETLNNTIVNAPLFMLPMADSLQNFVRSMFVPIVGKDGDGGILGFFLKKLENLPIISSLVSSTVNATTETIVLYITIFLLTSLVAIAPLIAIIGASFMTIAFYFLSVEILYLIIPFASIFAFSTGNLDIIKNLIKNTFLLAVKPVLIVVSVIMAMFVYEMFTQLNEVLISSMFEPLYALANDKVADSTWNPTTWFGGLAGMGNSIIFLFMKGVMAILSSIMTVFVCFYLVFNGANILLDLLGMRDGGFDVGGIIGDKVESKGTVGKMNTMV